MSQLTAISPLDGRYQNEIKELSPIFSESALMKYRLRVEVEYLIALSKEVKIKEVKGFSDEDRVYLRTIYEKFDTREAERVKKIEKTTNHDVKSLEYYLKEKIIKIKGLKDCVEFVHFGLTSEDVNNLAYSLMLKDGVSFYQSSVGKLLVELKSLAVKNRQTALLSLTHGQPASPTTVGKELAVFYSRIFRHLNHLKSFSLEAKLNGATGNYASFLVAYPNVDWPALAKNFIESFGLNQTPLTTQIEPHDCLAAVYDCLARINNIVNDLNKDMWLYISRGIFKQKKISGEVGSSTMPHKVNPIYFENSEGNLGLANSLLRFMSDKLPISRWQRDLSDSTVIRNQGAALGYSLLAIKSTLKGLSRIEVDKNRIAEELNSHWEVLAEPIQVVLRKIGYEKPYEKLKELMRGEKISKAGLRQFIRSLKIAKAEKDQLLKLSPEKYIGLAAKLVGRYIK